MTKLSAAMLMTALCGLVSAEEVNVIAMSTGFNSELESFGLIVKTDHDLACGSDRVVFERKVTHSIHIGTTASFISGSKSIEIGDASEYNEFFDACIGDYDSFVGYKEKTVSGGDGGSQGNINKVSCATILESDSQAASGIYTIDPDGEEGAIQSFDAYCDMEFDGGGWTLVASIKDETRKSGQSVMLDTNQYLANEKYLALIDSASEGVRFEVPDTEDVLVMIDDLGGHSCHNLSMHSIGGLLYRNNYISWAHHENSGCDGSGNDYSFLRWIGGQHLHIDSRSSQGYYTYYYDENSWNHYDTLGSSYVRHEVSGKELHIFVK